MVPFVLYVLCIYIANAVDYDQNKAITAVYHSYGAYCDAEDISNWNCKWCKKISSFAIKEAVYHKHLLVYTGYDSKNKQVVISFRGSKTIGNWFLDNQITQDKWRKNMGIHHGFWFGLNDLLKSGLNRSIHEIFHQYKHANVLITGHSLGGAMAQILALFLKTDPSYIALNIGRIHVISFGSPRWASKDLVAYYEEVVDENWRIVNKYDIIPLYPDETDGFFGYFHSKTVIEYTDYASLKYRICSTNGEARNCSSYLPKLTTRYHLHYMNESESCEKPGKLYCDYAGLPSLERRRFLDDLYNNCSDDSWLNTERTTDANTVGFGSNSWILIVVLSAGWLLAFVFFGLWIFQRHHINIRKAKQNDYRPMNEL